MWKVEFCIKTEKAQVSGKLNVQIHKTTDDSMTDCILYISKISSINFYKYCLNLLDL